MTVAQTRIYDYAGWEAISPRGFEARLARQRQAYRQAVGCCVATDWAARSIVDDYGIDPAKVHVVGIGRNHTPPQADRDWSVPRALFVGRDWEGKNGPAVLRAFARLRATHPEARLDVVGAHPPLSAPGVTGHGVLALGDPDQHRRLEQLFAEATVFVMPSLAEAAGIAYIEAGAAGVPSIGTSAGGPASIIGDGGLVVDPTDDDALVAAMLRLADPATAARMGERARRRSALFTWDQVARRLVGALAGAAPLPLAA
jgi:glycosyltransferase involved in cell wall biosynthesis